MTVHPALDTGIKLGFADSYLGALALVERLHRLLLDVIKVEFERINVLEINPVQALLLFNIGENEVTAGELKSRGYYQGSNVSYNLKKKVEMGYMHHQRSEIDRRSVRVRLTQKGCTIRDIVADLFYAILTGCKAKACSAQKGSRTSPIRCVGSNVTGPIRYVISTKPQKCHICP